MSLGVHPGPGTVARYGSATMWIGPGASAGLVDYLTRAGRELAASPGGELAERVAGVLRAGDPEPATPFAVVGAGDGGWVALLHGPVQLWDGTRWSVPDPNPGWLPLLLGQPPAIVVAPVGTHPPAPGNPAHDLERGAVPGSGFSLTPVPTPDPPQPATAARPASTEPPSGRGQPAAAATPVKTEPPPTDRPEVAPQSPVASGWPDPAEATAAGATTAAATAPGASADPAPAFPPPVAPAPPRAAPAGDPNPTTATTKPGAVVTDPPAERVGSSEESPSRTTLVSRRVPPPPPPPQPGGVAAGQRAAPSLEHPLIPPSSGGDPAATLTPRPQSSVALRRPPPAVIIDLSTAATARGEPLAPVAAPPVATTGGAVVSGVRCPRGHFNHPAALECLRCGTDLGGNRSQVSGTRPSLGVLIRDDSVVFGLDTGYVLGSTPDGDPTVTSGLARPLRLAGPAAEEISPTHAELRLTGWDVTVVDRGSAYGTFVLRPNEDQWARLPPYQAHVLAPGSHVACGQRIVTYASPWPA